MGMGGIRGVGLIGFVRGMGCRFFFLRGGMYEGVVLC